jgi:hypothetical protein
MVEIKLYKPQEKMQKKKKYFGPEFSTQNCDLMEEFCVQL